MSKSIKLKNNTYWDSSSIVHNKKSLSNYLFGELTVISKNLQMIEADTWYDTGISGTDLSTGIYIVSTYIDTYNGTGLFWERTAGIMTWYSNATNNPLANEIPLHQSGHADNGGTIKLRTKREYNGVLKLQMSCGRAWTNTVPVYFYFKKIM